jgi:hypothetical protein
MDPGWRGRQTAEVNIASAVFVKQLVLGKL